MTNSRRTLLKALGAAGATSLAGGTGVVTAQTSGSDGQTQTPGAALRFVHAVPDAPAVDVYVNDSLLFSNVEFGEVTKYAPVSPGTYTVRLTPAGQANTTVFTKQITLESKYYSLAAVGELRDQSVGTLLIEDGDVALIRLVHASPDAPIVDVTADLTPGQGGMTTIFNSVSFADVTDYVALPAGTYTFQVRRSTEGDNGPVLTTIETTLAPETQYTVYAAGYASPQGEPATQPLDFVVTTDKIDPHEVNGVRGGQNGNGGGQNGNGGA